MNAMRKPPELQLNLSWVLGAALIFIGGFSVNTFASAVSDFLVIVAVAAGVATAALLNRRDFMLVRIPIRNLDWQDLCLLAVFVSGMIVMAWQRLATDLWSDGVYHASLASRPAQLFLFFIREAFPGAWTWISGVKAATVVQAFNLAFLILLLSVTLGGSWLLKQRTVLLAILWVAAFLWLRLALSTDLGFFAGGETPPVIFVENPQSDPHPTLRLLPIMAAGAIFGTSPFGFRMAGYVALIVLAVIMYAFTRDRWRRWPAALCMIAVATLPAVWQTALSVEASIWLALGGSVLFCALAMAERNEPLPIVQLATIAALAALSRAPAFLCLIPLICLIGLALMRSSRPGKGELAIAAALAALIVVSAAISVLFGTPAISDAPPLQQLIAALADATPYIAIVSVMGIAPLFFIGSALSVRDIETFGLALAVVGYFLFALAVFYGPTKALLWGTPRYQAEIVTAIVVAGLVSFARQSEEAEVARREAGKGKSWLGIAGPAGLGMVILSNLFAIVTLDRQQTRWISHANPGNGSKSDAEYETGAAFRAARDHGLGPSVYYVGIWYGGFQAILNRMNSDAYVSYSALNERHRAGWNVNLDAMTDDPDIKAVIVEPEADFGAIAHLTAKGWPSETLTSMRSGLRILIFYRPGVLAAGSAS